MSEKGRGQRENLVKLPILKLMDSGGGPQHFVFLHESEHNYMSEVHKIADEFIKFEYEKPLITSITIATIYATIAISAKNPNEALGSTAVTPAEKPSKKIDTKRSIIHGKSFNIVCRITNHTFLKLANPSDKKVV